MPSMVTGDQDKAQQDGPREPVEVAPVKCICEWATIDSGSMFYSRIIKRDPDCPAHRR